MRKKRILVALILVFLGISLSYAQRTPVKHVVEIKKLKFIPAEITVQKGDTIVWINKDFFPHDVAKFKDKSWQSSPLQQGESWAKVISKTEDYFCTLHVVMKGKIIVKD